MNPASTSQQTLLRRWREDDLPFLTQLRNDIDLQARLLSTARGSTLADVRAWAERRSSTPGMIFRIIADWSAGRGAGYIQAERETNIAGRCWRLGICVARDFQGAGRGTAAIRLLENLLIAEHGADRLVLEVDTANWAAISCYQGLAFAETSRHSGHVVVCGIRRDVIRMEKRLGGKAHSA